MCSNHTQTYKRKIIEAVIYVGDSIRVKTFPVMAVSIMSIADGFVFVTQLEADPEPLLACKLQSALKVCEPYRPTGRYPLGTNPIEEQLLVCELPNTPVKVWRQGTTSTIALP